MQIDIKHGPSYSQAVVNLAANEDMRVEAGAMVSYSAGVTTDTKVEGGFFGGLKDKVGSEEALIGWIIPQITQRSSN